MTQHPTPAQDDDVTGHGRNSPVQSGDDDVAGHVIRGHIDQTHDDDTEGHAARGKA